MSLCEVLEKDRDADFSALICPLFLNGRHGAASLLFDAIRINLHHIARKNEEL